MKSFRNFRDNWEKSSFRLKILALLKPWRPKKWLKNAIKSEISPLLKPHGPSRHLLYNISDINAKVGDFDRSTALGWFSS